MSGCSDEMFMHSWLQPWSFLLFFFPRVSLSVFQIKIGRELIRHTNMSSADYADAHQLPEDKIVTNNTLHLPGDLGARSHAPKSSETFCIAMVT